MRVEIDEHSGFCFGVVNAIRKAEQELERGMLYCIGDIVHNDLEVERLRLRGLKTIEHEQFARLQHCRVLFRAHGEPPVSYEIAQKNEVEVIDAEFPGANNTYYVYLLEQGPAPNGDRFLNGHATNCATQFQVDAYAMENGRYPITGYNNDGSPVIDEESGYTESGFCTFTVPTFDLDYKGFTSEMFNMYKNREPRFYASIFYNEGVWPNTVTDKPVYINKYGTDGSNSSDYNRTRYLITKFVHPGSTLNPYNLNYERSWSNFRYAEILLNYVEAKIELGELDDEVLGYWNAVRNRGGVPDIETVYPDVKSDQNLARDLIHRERQVEFAVENIRWFDANRWKIATETNHGKTYGMNVNISSKNALRSEYYQRTAFETRVFLERQYLQPIPQTAIINNLYLSPCW